MAFPDDAGAPRLGGILSIVEATGIMSTRMPSARLAILLVATLAFLLGCPEVGGP
jgi:hypothetical protein